MEIDEDLELGETFKVIVGACTLYRAKPAQRDLFYFDLFKPWLEMCKFCLKQSVPNITKFKRDESI